jgi:hypothetical protein
MSNSPQSLSKNSSSVFKEAILNVSPETVHQFLRAQPDFLNTYVPSHHNSKNWLIFAMELYDQDQPLTPSQWEVLNQLKLCNGSDASGLGPMARVCQMQNEELLKWLMPLYSLTRKKALRYWVESAFKNPGWYDPLAILDLWEKNTRRPQSNLPIYILVLCFLQNSEPLLLKKLTDRVLPAYLPWISKFPDILSTLYQRQWLMHQKGECMIFSPTTETHHAFSLIFDQARDAPGFSLATEKTFLASHSLMENLTLHQTTPKLVSNANLNRL